MTSAFLFLGGLAFLSVGLLFALRPALTQQIADRLSRRLTKPLDKRQSREYRDDFRRILMGRRGHLWLIYMGGFWIAVAVYKWFR